jgi:hypothetical protein
MKSSGNLVPLLAVEFDHIQFNRELHNGFGSPMAEGPINIRHEFTKGHCVPSGSGLALGDSVNLHGEIRASVWD